MTSPLLAAARDALRHFMPGYLRVEVDESRPEAPTLRFGCACGATSSFTIGKRLRGNADWLADACLGAALRFLESHQHPESEAQPEEQRSPKPQAAGSTPARLATTAGDASTSSSSEASALPRRSTMPATTERSAESGEGAAAAGPAAAAAAPSTGATSTRSGGSDGREEGQQAGVPGLGRDEVALGPHAPGRSEDAAGRHEGDAEGRREGEGQALTLPDGSRLVERAAAAGLRAFTGPVPRPRRALDPARLEMVRAMAASCRKVWAQNPGLTGWTMREHKAGVNVACFLIEEQLFARQRAARRFVR